MSFYLHIYFQRISISKKYDFLLKRQPFPHSQGNGKPSRILQKHCKVTEKHDKNNGHRHSEIQFFLLSPTPSRIRSSKFTFLSMLEWRNFQFTYSHAFVLFVTQFLRSCDNSFLLNTTQRCRRRLELKRTFHGQLR